MSSATIESSASTSSSDVTTGRSPTEEALRVVGAAGCGIPVEVADGDEVEFEEADVGQRCEAAEMAPAHRAGSDEGQRQPAHAPPSEAAHPATHPINRRPALGTSIRAGTARVGGLTTSAMMPVANWCS